MLNVFCFHGRVRSEPVLLNSKKTGNTFIKFTASIDGDMPHYVRKIIAEEKGQTSGNWGEVYVDCFAFKDKNGKFPGDYILRNLHKYDIISGSGRLSAGKKPVKEGEYPFMEDLMRFLYSCAPPPGMSKQQMIEQIKRIISTNKSAYRSNWVYGDYLYLQLKDVYLIKPWTEKPKNPYNKTNFTNNMGTPPKKDIQSGGMVSSDQRVNDEDIIFDLDDNERG